MNHSINFLLFKKTLRSHHKLRWGLPLTFCKLIVYSP
nr:MAG TPA: hypothetical protein [Caudoviricetes sp.]